LASRQAGAAKEIDMRTQFLKLPDLEETQNQGFPKSLKITLVHIHRWRLLVLTLLLPSI
jgi:hypothetical protein